MWHFTTRKAAISLRKEERWSRLFRCSIFFKIVEYGDVQRAKAEAKCLRYRTGSFARYAGLVVKMDSSPGAYAPGFTLSPAPQALTHCALLCLSVMVWLSALFISSNSRLSSS